MKKFYLLIFLLISLLSSYSQGKTAIIKYTGEAPEIDGFIDDVWNIATPQTIDINFREESPTIGVSTWQALYDNDNFYLVISVDDDNHWPSWESGGNTWEYDKPEVYWDWNDALQDGVGAGTGSSGHYQLADGFVDGLYDSPIITSFSQGSNNPGGTFAYSLIGESYVYEYSIPFTNFYDKDGVQITKDNALAKAAIGFDITIVDQDEGVTTIRQRASWCNAGGIDEAWNNMDDAGHITLAPQYGINKSNIEFGYKAGNSDTINVFSSSSWTVSSNESWLTVSPLSGTGDGRFSVTATENTGATRTAIVTFSSTGLSDKFLTIIQYEKNTVFPGNLRNCIDSDLANITELILLGTIDARDFKLIRDEMPLLETLDLSNVTVVSYSGFSGTSLWGNVNYLANELPQHAFYNKASIQSLVLPSTVVVLREESITICENLTDVTLPSGLTTICSRVFNQTPDLLLINIPATVSYIARVAFSGSPAEVIVDPNNLKYSSVDGILFNYDKTNLLHCSSLKTGNYSIPPGTKTIGDFAFSSCTQLLEINLPESIDSISEYAFVGCTGINSIIINDGANFIGRSAFEGCNSLDYLKIPLSINRINQEAFNLCTNLDSIQINSLHPDQILIENNIFNNVDKTNCKLKVPQGTITEYQNAAQWQDFQNIEEIQGLFPSISNLFFNYPASSKSIFISSSVNWNAESSEEWLSLNPSSSEGSDSLSITVTENNGNIRTATITIHPNGLPDQTITVTQNGIIQVTSGNLASVLGERLAITPSLKLTGTIDARDFKTMRDAMPLLSEIDLSGVNIESYNGSAGSSIFGELNYAANEVPTTAFYNGTLDGNTTLVSIILPPTATHIRSQAFFNCKNLISVTLPSSLISIDSQVFGICSKLTNIIFPNSLLQISDFSFEGCTLLQDINIPASVTHIGSSAFNFCAGPFTVDESNQNYSSLDGVLFDKDRINLIKCLNSQSGEYTIPSTVKNIGSYAFYNCNNITSIVIPEGVTTLEYYSFYSCNDLTSITIPSTVTTIGNTAFANSYALSSIYSYSIAPVNLYYISSVFDGINKTTCTLYVPYGSKSAYQNAVKWQDFQNIEEIQGLFLSTTSMSFNSSASTKKIFIASSVEWSAESSESWISLDPNSSAVSDSLSISVTDNTGESRSATITLHPSGFPDQTITITQRKNVKAVIEFTSEAPEIDGFIDEIWSSATPNHINVNFRDEIPTIGNSTWQALYDKDNFYLLVFVDDDDHWPGWESGGNNWEYDQPEIYWDWNDDLRDGGGAMTYNSGHYQLANGFLPESYDVPTTISFFSGEMNPSGTYCYSLTGEKYIYEYAVPLVNFHDRDGLQITKDIALAKTAVGFDITIVDQDEGLTTIRQRANWSNAGEIDEAWNNMDDAGQITFAPQNGISKSKINLGYKAGSSDTIDVVTNATWNISNDQSWLTISPISGTGNGRFAITASENTGEKRTASLVFHLTGFPDKSITVTQDGVLQVTAGNLATLLGEQLTTTTYLNLIGTIDARDFKTMRDEMPLLAKIDLSGVTIVEYEGPEGTSNWGNLHYYANHVPEHAFMNSYWQGKTTLVSVILPESVTNIGNYAFYSCADLAQIILPTSLLTIDNNAFSNCSNLTSVIIPEGVTRIGWAAFTGCPNLISAFFPSTLIEITNYAFDNCPKLKDINIPASVTVIRDYAFRNCAGPFIVDEGNPNYSSSNGVLFDKNQITLIQCPNSFAVEYSIPKSVKIIGAYSFMYCNNLTSINFHEGVTTISEHSVFNCGALTSITIPSTVTAIGHSAFVYNYSLSSIYSYLTTPVDLNNKNNVFEGINIVNCTLYVPFSTKPEYQNADQWQNFQNIVEMQGLFPPTTSLTFNPPAATTNIFIASSVGWSAESSESWLSFDPSSSEGSDSLSISVTENTGEVRTASITFHPTGFSDKIISVTQYGVVQVTAGNLAAVLGDQLATITSLTLAGTIDARDFKTMRDVMPSLEEIDLSRVTIVEYHGLEGTIHSLENFNYNANEVPESAFMYSNWQGKKTLLSVILPESATTINSMAFYFCINLSNIILPSSLKMINTNAFSYCYNLESVIFPASLAEIRENAFSYCSILKDFYIPSSVTEIGDFAFNSCAGPFIVDQDNPKYSSLDGVLFDKNQNCLIQYPSSLIGEYTVPSSVKTIGSQAFFNCDSLTVITISEGITTISDYSFYDCNNLTSIEIPSSIMTIGNYAFAISDKLESIDVYSSTPVDLSNIYNVFYGINKTTCTLHVPYGSKSAYQNAAQWMDFTNIVEATSGFGVGIKSILLPYAASDTTIDVFANVPWNVTSDQSWLSVLPQSGTNDGSFSISATVNTNHKRRATVTISSTGYRNQLIYITQESSIPKIVLSDSCDLSAPLVCDTINEVITNSHEQFLRFIPEQNGTYTFYSESSSDPVVSVQDSLGTNFGSNNDSWTDRNFIISCDLIAGEEYYLKLRNFNGDNQIIDLFITGGTFMCNKNSIPENQDISSLTLSEIADTCFNAYDTITLAGDGSSVIFELGSTINLIAGKSIRLLPGFHAQFGSWMDAHITTDSSFCDRLSVSIVSLPADKSISENFIKQNDSNPIITKTAKVYPNPNNGNFNIEFSNLQLGSDILIYNMQGRLVHKETIQNTNIQQINIIGQKRGVYVLKIRDGKEMINHKLIIY